MVKVACLCDTGLEVAKNTTWAVSSVGRASALQAECRQFDPGTAQFSLLSFKKDKLYYKTGRLAQLGERLPYKQNVVSSILALPIFSLFNLERKVIFIKPGG